MSVFQTIVLTTGVSFIVVWVSLALYEGAVVGPKQRRLERKVHDLDQRLKKLYGELE